MGAGSQVENPTARPGGVAHPLEQDGTSIHDMDPNSPLGR